MSHNATYGPAPYARIPLEVQTEHDDERFAPSEIYAGVAFISDALLSKMHWIRVFEQRNVRWTITRTVQRQTEIVVKHHWNAELQELDSGIKTRSRHVTCRDLGWRGQHRPVNAHSAMQTHL